MGARKKLNGVHLTGSIVVAGVIGVAAGSVPIFAVTLAGLLLAHVWRGNIRP